MAPSAVEGDAVPLPHDIALRGAGPGLEIAADQVRTGYGQGHPASGIGNAAPGVVARTPGDGAGKLDGQALDGIAENGGFHSCEDGVGHRNRCGSEFLAIVKGRHDDRLARFVQGVARDREGQLRRADRGLGRYCDAHLPAHAVVVAGGRARQGQRDHRRHRQNLAGLGSRRGHGLSAAAFGQRLRIDRQGDFRYVVGQIEVDPGAENNLATKDSA